MRVGRSALALPDCWTRVLRRSAGWRRMEEVRPEQRPAAKWKTVLDAARATRVVSLGKLQSSIELVRACRRYAYMWRC